MPLSEYNILALKTTVFIQCGFCAKAITAVTFWVEIGSVTPSKKLCPLLVLRDRFVVMNFSSQNAGLGDLEDSLESNPFADSPPSRHTEENNNTLAIGQDLPTQEPDQPYTAEEPESTAVAAAATAQSSDDVDVAQNLENLHIYTEQSAEQQQQQQQETYHQQEQEQQQSGEQQDSQVCSGIKQKKKWWQTANIYFSFQSESFEIPKSGSRPYFEVSVQDPQKVGDTINAHIVYKVRTKVKKKSYPHLQKKSRKENIPLFAYKLDIG